MASLWRMVDRSSETTRDREKTKGAVTPTVKAVADWTYAYRQSEAGPVVRRRRTKQRQVKGRSRTGQQLDSRNPSLNSA